MLLQNIKETNTIDKVRQQYCVLTRDTKLKQINIYIYIYINMSKNILNIRDFKQGFCIYRFIGGLIRK